MSWRAAAKCRDRDPSEFVIYEVHKRKVVDLEPTDEIKHLCRDCPVRVECLSAAMSGREHGYWAGTTHAQREAMRREKL